jgi:hypothetical protein
MALLASGAVCAASSPAAAQSWGRGPLPREGACFYQNANYDGQYFCVEPGGDLDRLPSGANDRVSSIRVLGRAEVTVFVDSRFRGESRRFDANVRDLEDLNFNDLISSVEVRSRSSGGSRGGGRSPYASQNPDVIVRRAFQDILERDPDPAGLRLYRSRIIDDGWTERQVRDALRNSTEYREKHTMTPAKAQEIVRRAYLSVLGREPDPGSLNYVERVFRSKWTQQDVERELRKSDEYRSRSR